MSERAGTDQVRHDEVEELLGAYALDALEPDEVDLVEDHLVGCPRCRAEVDGHREVAAHLAMGGAPAPDQLWDRIAGAISGDAPPPLRLVVAPGPAAPSTASVPVAPSTAYGTRRRMPTLAAAAAVVVALVTTGFAVGASTGDDDGPEVVPSELSQAALAAFADPEARVARLVDDDDVALVRVAVLPSGDGYALAGALPALDDGIYQLWGSDGDTVVSLGNLGDDPQIVAFHTDPEDHDVLMITAEDEPVERSSRPAVVIGELA